MEKPIIHVDMDDTIAAYSSAVQDAIAQNPGIQFPQSQFDFFRKLAPITGAIEGLKLLTEWGYDVYILTAPSPLNPLCYTEKRVWIEDHLGYSYVEKLILTMNKGLIKGDFLIDDWTEGRGQENFLGQLIHFGSPRFPDWGTVSNYFKGLKG